MKLELSNIRLVDLLPNKKILKGASVIRKREGKNFQEESKITRGIIKNKFDKEKLIEQKNFVDTKDIFQNQFSVSRNSFLEVISRFLVFFNRIFDPVKQILNGGILLRDNHHHIFKILKIENSKVKILKENSLKIVLVLIASSHRLDGKLKEQPLFVKEWNEVGEYVEIFLEGLEEQEEVTFLILF